MGHTVYFVAYNVGSLCETIDLPITRRFKPFRVDVERVPDVEFKQRITCIRGSVRQVRKAKNLGIGRSMCSTSEDKMGGLQTTVGMGYVNCLPPQSGLTSTRSNMKRHFATGNLSTLRSCDTQTIMHVNYGHVTETYMSGFHSVKRKAYPDSCRETRNLSLLEQ